MGWLFSSTFRQFHTAKKTQAPMHLLSACPLSELAPASSAAMRVAIGNATGHCDYTLELVRWKQIGMWACAGVGALIGIVLSAWLAG